MALSGNVGHVGNALCIAALCVIELKGTSFSFLAADVFCRFNFVQKCQIMQKRNLFLLPQRLASSVLWPGRGELHENEAHVKESRSLCVNCTPHTWTDVACVVGSRHFGCKFAKQKTQNTAGGEV